MLWLLSGWLPSLINQAYCCNQAPVVRRLHNAIHPINHYPRDSVTYLSNNAGQPSKPNLRKSWIVRQEANSIFFNIYTENRENISLAAKLMQWNKRKHFFLGITVTKIMDKVTFAVTFDVFAHPPNRKDVLGGKGGGGGGEEQPIVKFQNSAIKHR